MREITLGQPWVLIALVAVPAVLAAWVLGQRRAARRVRALSREEAGGPRYFAGGCLAVAAALAVVAAAQPRWGTTESFVPRRGAEVVLVVDVSRSMDGKDVAPSRLEATKAALTKTLQRLNGDRVGLVVFAGNARLRFPLTTDFSAATQVISSLETGPVIVEGGTSVAAGLDIAMDVFDSGSDGGGRLIVLVSDGDDLGADPAAAATAVRNSGIDFIVAGVGTGDGATVPVFDSKSKTTVQKLGRDGQPIVSKLNETFLRALAVAAGGRYVGADLQVLPATVEGRVSTLKRLRIDERPTEIPVERFQWFAGAALALLVLASAAERMPRWPRRRMRAIGLVGMALFVLPGCATLAHDLNEDARRAYDVGDYDRAINLFIEVQAERPNDPAVSLNLARALYEAGRFEEAILAARRLLNLPSPETQARGYASIGHAEFAVGRLPNSLEAFRRALLENPGDENSRHDFEVVLRMLRPLEGASEQPPPDGNQPSNGQPTPPPGGPSDPNKPGQPPGSPPGQGTPSPGSQPGGETGAPSNDPARNPDAIDRRLEQIDAQVNALLLQAGENPTASEALEILQLLAERNRIAALRDGLAGGGNPGDY